MLLPILVGQPTRINVMIMTKSMTILITMINVIMKIKTITIKMATVMVVTGNQHGKGQV